MPDPTEHARRARTEPQTKGETAERKTRPEATSSTWRLPAGLISKRDADAEGPCTD